MALGIFSFECFKKVRKNMFEKVLEEIKLRNPIVHCITNYVTVNDCANAILAVNGSPIMADDIHEVEEITTICNALVINIGTLNERTVASMIKAGKMANHLNHPVVLDPVGAGASKLRTNTAKKQMCIRDSLMSNKDEVLQE